MAAGTAAKKKAASATALRNSKETLVQIECGADDYETQTTVTSVDDSAIGMPSHLGGGDTLKRTKSDNALMQHDDATMVNAPPKTPQNCKSIVYKRTRTAHPNSRTAAACASPGTATSRT